jgi:hypothetical protein
MLKLLNCAMVHLYSVPLYKPYEINKAVRKFNVVLTGEVLYKFKSGLKSKLFES